MSDWRSDIDREIAKDYKLRKKIERIIEKNKKVVNDDTYTES